MRRAVEMLWWLLCAAVALLLVAWALGWLDRCATPGSVGAAVVAASEPRLIQPGGSSRLPGPYRPCGQYSCPCQTRVPGVQCHALSAHWGTGGAHRSLSVAAAERSHRVVWRLGRSSCRCPVSSPCPRSSAARSGDRLWLVSPNGASDLSWDASDAQLIPFPERPAPQAPPSHAGPVARLRNAPGLPPKARCFVPAPARSGARSRDAANADEWKGWV